MSVSSVVSFSRLEIFETLPGMEIATYRLAPSIGMTPTILYVSDTYYYKPDIDGKQDRVFVPSKQVAESIVHMNITSQLGYRVDAHPAVFAVPEQEVNTKYVINELRSKTDEMLKRQRKWFAALIKMADDDWQIAHRHGMISDIQRKAAREAGLQREWLLTIDDEMEAVKKIECPFCGQGLLNPDAPICPSCQKVHNPVKMKEVEARMKTLMEGNKELAKV